MNEIYGIGEYVISDHPASEIDLLETQWRKLEQGKDMTAFQSFDWQRGLFELYRKERTRNLFRQWRYIEVLRDGQTVLIAPLEIKKMGIGYKNLGAARGVYFTGRMGHTDYLNFVYDEFDPEAVKTLIEYVSKQYRQKRFCLGRMLESSESHQWLSDTYKAKRQAVSCAALILPETFEEYRLSLSKSTRQNNRTALNRAKKNDLVLTPELVLDVKDPALQEQLIALNEQRLKKKTAASKREISLAGSVYCFFGDVFRKLFCAKPDLIRQSKNTFCFLVRSEQQLVGFFWGIRHVAKKEFYVILVGVDQEYEWYSPNISHLYSFLEEYYAEGRQDIKVLDFTRGAEGYKKTIGCTNRPVSGLVFHIH